MLRHLYIESVIIICVVRIEGFLKTSTLLHGLLPELLPYHNNNNNNICGSHFSSAAVARRSMILQDSKSSSAEIIRSLEAALTANNIQVRQGAIQELLNQRHWIYPSQRIANLRKMLNEDQLYSIFNSNHHLKSATGLFEFLRYKESCVLYGHKAQGKTQFLFFVFRLLQAMGEKVIFLDRSMLPLEADNNVDISAVYFCGNWWKDSFLDFRGPVTDTLKLFYQDSSTRSFGLFTKALRQLVRSTGTRIWIIVDEVVLFQHFPIDLPEEQNMGPFNWIITGSAGIGSWVGERHLEKLVFDLPLFTKDESTDFATNLCRHLNINLELTIGVPTDGINDWLEERFGGIVGYTAEMLLEVSKGQSVSQYISSLNDRINRMFMSVAKRRNLSEEQLASVWLKDMKSEDNNWNHVRDAGLCGSSTPRGVIFTLILKCLCKYAVAEDLLTLVIYFRSKFTVDPGLDGCLLELEEVLKLRAGRSITASLVRSIDGNWMVVDKPVDLPPISSASTTWLYDVSHSRLEKILINFQATSSASLCNLVLVPSGFDVIDVVLVNTNKGNPAIYGIQITRSIKPFAKHYTFDTCPERSKEKLMQLWQVISNQFTFDDTVKQYYVMLAPNCAKDEFKPPSGVSTTDIYFSPSSVIKEYNAANSNKSTRSRSTKTTRVKKDKNIAT